MGGGRRSLPHVEWAPVPWPTVPGMTRRHFLAGTAGLAWLAACGGDDRDESSGGWTTFAGGSETVGELVLIRRFAPRTLVPGEQRVPVVLGDQNGLLPPDRVPPTLTGQLLTEAGEPASDAVIAERHGTELGQPYFPFATALDAPGIFTLAVEVAGQVATAAVDVTDPDEVAIPKVGDPLPPFDTPTVANGRGVDPICTREPACPLHDVTLTEALAAGRPVVYLVGTPAHCKTAVCGPVLDLMLAERETRGDAITMVHAEIYTDDTITTVAPAVRAYQLDFEPVLFLADGDGVLVERLDAIWDAAELRAGLDRLV
jgi:hypothetical protein